MNEIVCPACNGNKFTLVLRKPPDIGPWQNKFLPDPPVERDRLTCTTCGGLGKISNEED